jgi:hypothetical protein
MTRFRPARFALHPQGQPGAVVLGRDRKPLGKEVLAYLWIEIDKTEELGGV